MNGQAIRELLLEELIISVKKNLGTDYSEEFIRELLNSAWEHQHDPNQEKLNMKFNQILEKYEYKL